MTATAAVLVIEDNLELADCVREALESAGYYVVTASNGVEGLEALRTVTPRLILLDLAMPVMNGTEFMAELRRRRHETPVVVASAFADFIGVPADVREVIRKPFSTRRVLEAVRRHS